MKIYIEQFDLHEDDIEECQDRDQLLKWKIDVEGLILIIRNKIYELKLLKKQRINYDRDLFVRTCRFYNILTRVISLINHKLSEIKRDAQNSKDKILIDCLKEIVPSELFDQAIDMMYNRIK